jgi:hypothetical protein
MLVAPATKDRPLLANHMIFARRELTAAFLTPAAKEEAADTRYLPAAKVF